MRPLNRHSLQRLQKIVSIFSFDFKQKFIFLYDNFSKMLCLLLFGFVSGSMFGSIANTIPHNGILDRSVALVLAFCIEMINYLTYHVEGRSFLFIISSRQIETRFWRFVNMFKIGLMLGFFVDAFKVGS